VIDFHLNSKSGVASYLQLIRQVRLALRLGLLQAGDQLPTVKDVAGSLAINPNTVLKAYRLLEYEGLVAAKPGVGTFVTKTVSDASVAAHQALSLELSAWVGHARRAGLDLDDMEGLFQRAVQSAAREEAV
jgi:GntR family transcriptional regulator